MNIYKRKDGRYEGRIKTPEDHGYISFYGKSYEETERKIKEYIDNLISMTPPSGMTVKKLFEEWINAISVQVKESTLANYRMRIKSHIIPVFGNINTDDLNTRQIQEFITEKLSYGLSSSYVADIIGALKSMFRFGTRQYGIANPLLDIILPPKKKPQIQLLTNSQQTQLKQYLSINNSLVAVGIALPLFTGLRLGEVCALKWSDINLNNKTLTVNRTIQRIHDSTEKVTKLVISSPKSVSSQRIIPLPDCIVNMLKKHESDRECYLLSGTNKPVEPRIMQYRFQAVLKKKNLPSIHFHALRHMFATNCIELGFDIKLLSEILGHASVEVTLNRYVHSSFERKISFMQKLSLSI